MKETVDYVFVLPTLKATGGNLEVVRLARDLQGAGCAVIIYSLWQSDYSIVTEGLEVVTLFEKSVRPWLAALSLPMIVMRFYLLSRRRASSRSKIILTHYSTYLLNLLISRSRRWVFVQDTEWNFVPAGMVRSALRAFILFTYRRSTILTANEFLDRELQKYKLQIAGTADIWADSFFGERRENRVRDIDVAFILRKGVHKRADWGLSFLEHLRSIYPDLRVLVISPDEQVLGTIEGVTVLTRPSRAEIRTAYRRSRIFVLFSEHEGFGLPPLEAMGSGCVPLCRDAGGIRAYMEPEFEANIVPLNAPPEALIQRLAQILNDPDEWSKLSISAQDVFRKGLYRAADRVPALKRCGFIDEPSGPA